MNTLPLFTGIEEDLRAVIQKMRSAARVEIHTLDDALAEVVASGGKLVRPALAIMTSRMYGTDRDKMLSLAASVEMLHTATLVHDDMIDRSDKRRGHPTLHNMLNASSAVLLGDYLFAQAAEWAAETDNVRVVRIFSNTLMTIVEGELRQIWAQHDWDRAQEDYFNRIYGKTAALFAAACESGAVLGGASEDVVQSLREYGRLLGLAFQVVDDVLDYAGDEARLGKPVGSDLRGGNITLPLIVYVRDYARDGVAGKMLDGEQLSDDEIQDIVSGVVSSGAIEDSLAEAQGLVDEAKANLTRVPANEHSSTLESLADYVVHRQR